jgi:hypothetical protein
MIPPHRQCERGVPATCERPPFSCLVYRRAFRGMDLLFRYPKGDWAQYNAGLSIEVHPVGNIELFNHTVPQHTQAHPRELPLFRYAKSGTCAALCKRHKSSRSATLQMTPQDVRRRPSTQRIERLHWSISGDTGLVSAGRIDKDTPPLTTPGHTSRSSAMDISSHIFQITIHGGPWPTLPPARPSPPSMTRGPEGLSVFS